MNNSDPTSLKSEDSMINPEQKQVMLDFFIDHPYLMLNKNNDTFSVNDSIVLWIKLSEKLNSTLESTTKDWKFWRAAWENIYSKLEEKLLGTDCNLDKHFVELFTKAKSIPFDELVTKNIGLVHCQNTKTILSVSETQEVIVLGRQCSEKNTTNKSERVEVEENNENDNCEVLYNPMIVTEEIMGAASEITIPLETQVTNKKDEHTDCSVPETQQKNSQHQEQSISNNLTLLEKVLIKKLVKEDAAKMKYLRQKLKLQRDYHKRKLGLMRELLKIKQRKIKAEEKQAVALTCIARTLDRALPRVISRTGNSHSQ